MPDRKPEQTVPERWDELVRSDKPIPGDWKRDRWEQADAEDEQVTDDDERGS